MFVETADPREARVCFDRKLAEGVATSLSVCNRALADLCAWSAGPVSAPVESLDHPGMLREARELARLGPQVVVRLPLNVEGLRTARACAQEGIETHVTACDSPMQAVLAAKAGARYVSPIATPADQGGAGGNELIRGIVAALKTYNFATEVLAAPVRTPSHVVDVALAGAAIAAVPLAVLEQVVKSPAAGGGSAERK
ncbi:MAG: transaldolase family protein [Verrucomicrobiota bacterium]